MDLNSTATRVNACHDDGTRINRVGHPTDPHGRDNLHSAPDPFSVLGEPFTSYGRLVVAVDDAKRVLWEARVAGERNRIARAELDYERAVAALLNFKEHGANAFLLCARFATELYPASVQGKLDPAFRRELTSTQVGLDELENALVNLAKKVGATPAEVLA